MLCIKSLLLAVLLVELVVYWLSTTPLLCPKSDRDSDAYLGHLPLNRPHISMEDGAYENLQAANVTCMHVYQNMFWKAKTQNRKMFYFTDFFLKNVLGQKVKNKVI